MGQYEVILEFEGFSGRIIHLIEATFECCIGRADAYDRAEAARLRQDLRPVAILIINLLTAILVHQDGHMRPIPGPPMAEDDPTIVDYETKALRVYREASLNQQDATLVRLFVQLRVAFEQFRRAERSASGPYAMWLTSRRGFNY